MCRMLTHGERRNDFAVWTVRTHLFRVRRSSHFPSSLPSSTTTSTALLCRAVCEGPFPFWSKGQYGIPVYRSNGPFTGRTVTLRTCPHQNRQTSVTACENCGWWCTLHRQGHCGALAPVYSSGVWSVVCVVCLFTHHFSGGEPVSATRTFFGICGVQL